MLPKKCLVDTNVPIIANCASNDISPELIGCVSACIKAIEHVIKNKALVVDSGNEIFNEYLKHLSLKGQPGVGDHFIKWVYDYRWTLPASSRVAITKNKDSYDEFPEHDDLRNFDPSDRKFVAVSNAHPEKPPILQATDSKWLGWKDALAEAGITVDFLCPEYIKGKYKKKMEPCKQHLFDFPPHHT